LRVFFGYTGHGLGIVGVGRMLGKSELPGVIPKETLTNPNYQENPPSWLLISDKIKEETG
jgi:hypothetical protein